MEHFLTDDGQYLVVRLDQGDFIIEGIEQAAREAGVTDGFVSSCIGTLDICKLHLVMTTGYPPVETYPTIVGPLELNSASGVLADGKLHVHAMISDAQRCLGGHLEPGSRVLYLAEVVLRVFSGTKLQRVPHPDTGIMLLKKQ